MDIVNECFCKQVNHTAKRYATSFNVAYKHLLFRSQFPLLTYDTYGSKKYFLVVGPILEGRCIPPWLMLVLVLPCFACFGVAPNLPRCGNPCFDETDQKVKCHADHWDARKEIVKGRDLQGQTNDTITKHNLKHFKHLQTQPSNIFKYLQIRYACGII